MKCARVFLWFVGLMFIAFGAGFVLAPDIVFPLYTGAPLLTASAVTDVRAHNGGLGIGAGLWLLYCLKGHIRFGMVGVAMIHAAIATSRMLGFVLDGYPNIFMVCFLAVEISLAAGAVLILRRMQAEQASCRSHSPQQSLPSLTAGRAYPGRA